MSMPTIPNINPEITLDIKDTISLLLGSVALEGIGLSHIINAEGEKMQYALGTLHKDKELTEEEDINDIIKVSDSVVKTLYSVLQNQMMINMRLQGALEIYLKL